MVRASRVWYFCAATAVMFIVTGAAYGVASGTFTGTVKDNTGAPLIGAIVTMVEGNSAAGGAAQADRSRVPYGARGPVATSADLMILQD